MSALLSLLFLACLFYGFRYAYLAIKTPRGTWYTFTALDGLVMKGNSVGPRGLAVLSVVMFLVPLVVGGRAALLGGTGAWRGLRHECNALVTAEELSHATGLAFDKPVSSSDFATGCDAMWGAMSSREGEAFESDMVTVRVSRSEEPSYAMSSMEMSEMDVTPLELGEWALLGETDGQAPPDEPAPPAETPSVADELGLEDRFAIVRMPLASPQPSTRAIVSRCGVMMEIEAQGSVAPKHVEKLAELATPRMDRLCKFASPWPTFAPWVKPVAFTGERPQPDPLAVEKRAVSRGDDAAEAWKFDDAVAQFDKALKLRITRLGADDAEVGVLQRRLGWVLRSARRLDESETELRGALAIAEGHDDYVETARAHDSLGQTLVAMGRLRDGIAETERALALHDENKSPADDGDRVSVMNSLAMAYGDSGDHKKAAALFLKVLAADEANDPRGVEAANSMHNLALEYRDSSRVPKSIPLFEKALGILEEKLGANHARLIPTLNGLAGAYYLQSKFDDADRYAQRALAVSEANGKEADAVTLAVLGDIARSEGRNKDALRWLNQTVDLEDQAHPGGTAETVRTLIKRAVVLSALGRESESRVDERRAIQLAEEIYGKGHREVVQKLEWLADDLQDVGNATRARELRTRAKTMKTRRM